jgi:hypothetical protein
VVHATQRVERRGDARRVAPPPAQREALGHVALGGVQVAAAIGVRAQPVEDHRLRILVALSTGHDKRLAQVGLGERVIALV